MPSDASAVLIGRTFRVAAIDGTPTLESPVADLEFGTDGRVTGCATVNRIFGPYAIDGGTLTCGPLAGTLMAGPPEAMDQETRLHRALARPLEVLATDGGRGVELAADGAVVLLLEPYAATETL
jgi:heat shock protein HslJ